MRDDLKKLFESLTQEEKMKAFIELTEQHLSGANDEEKARIMMSIMPKIMSGNMEEIERYKIENPSATNTEIAQYLKISENSLDYFIKDKSDVESSSCCGGPDLDSSEGMDEKDYETIRLVKTKNICPMCEDYAKEQVEKPVVVMSCEGACLRGEISRRAANHICHDLLPEKTVRLCLGGAFTKDGGQRNLVKNAQRVVALEGCFIKCASRMMKGVVEDLEPEIIMTDNLFDFDTDLFGINEMSEEDIKANAQIVANKIAEMI